MKALSVKPHWAALIASGRKTIETRKWSTSYRGPLLICATRPQGEAVCIVQLIDCRPATQNDCADACDSVAPNEFAWILSDVVTVTPFAVKGQLGIYNVDIPA